MPAYVVDGIRYRIPLTSIFRPRTLCKDLLATDAQRRARVAAKHDTNFWHTQTETEVLWTDIAGNRWNLDDGVVTRQLKTRGISRKHIPSALSDGFIEELKDRLNEIQGGRLQSVRKADRKTWWHMSNLEPAGELISPESDRLVSFSNPLVTDGESVLKFEEVEFEKEYDVSRRKDIDQDFTLEDVTLLREIAAGWKKDQWRAISTRFNGMTGRIISPEQAKSVLNNYPG
ncbi:uncharacterized protein CDV56_100616 [Aspergillus thermomutatus]|uniref:Uncharacterized protein n=1 Tax=Aspergillus thermomutatus TaxID=41047 RepID=A0A397G194_ASPTH|nr:uncharacterized protein CDV56_100616 [Aspergillus thermomutatus]RHZ44487.1 hypothetical protein CDV56_100616 [Aspergillus thermomutatus]